MKKIVSLLLSLTLCFSLFSVPVKADGTKILTLGADLTDEQRQTVINFFGITDLDSVTVIQVNNAEEHATLNGLVPDAQIGSKTYSCAYIEPTTSGGINVRTANLNYVTDATLANVLMTSGIENCNLIVTAPFEVSGTGALTGVYKAYESMGIKLDSDKKEIAVEEMIVTSDLVSEYGDEINIVINEIKNEVAGREDLSDDEIKEVISNVADNHGVTLTEEDIAKLVPIVKKIIELDYDIGAFTSAINKLNELSEKTTGAANSIKEFFAKVSNFFSNLFGGKSDSDNGSSNGSIFDNINTDIFKFD